MRTLFLLALCACPLPAKTFYVTVAGLGGEPAYQRRFDRWAADIAKAIGARDPSAHLDTLSGPLATRARIGQTLDRVAAQMAPEDLFVLMLIGHGSFDGAEYKINLPGPDLSAAGLADLLDKLPAKRQLIVNMTSSSGASLAAFARPGRIVVAATKSGAENNATVFAGYWAEALRDPAADADKNQTLSALEAYRFAASKTARYFAEKKLLATEHAELSDSSAAPARDPSPQNGQGLLAASFPLLPPGPAAAADADPAKAKVRARKAALERQITELKYQKPSLPEEEYRTRLAALLLELARTQAEIDR